MELDFKGKKTKLISNDAIPLSQTVNLQHPLNGTSNNENGEIWKTFLRENVRILWLIT